MPNQYTPDIPYTVCGHEMTEQEYRHQRKNQWDRVNCKRCLQHNDGKRGWRESSRHVVHTIHEHKGDHGETL